MLTILQNSSFLQVPFLNLMANLRERAGSVRIRVGGNTQDTATMVSSTPDGAALEKDVINTSNPVCEVASCTWSKHSWDVSD